MISRRIAIDDVNDAVSDLIAGTVIRSVITF
jgi:Zn-dependent alcohol dehydrogenase